MSSKVKEVFIIVLLFVVIVFTIGVLFYDCIPQGGSILDTKEYVADKEVTKVLNEIKETTGESVTEEPKDSLIKSYSIGKDDLTGFASENYYESGKKDPFAEYSEPVEEEVVKTTVVSGDVNNTQTQNEVPENKNTVSNTNTTTNTVTNTVKNTNTVSKNTNTVESKAENKVENQVTTKEEVKEKSTGSYFEKKNSK